MEEKQCECKSLNNIGSPSLIGGLIAYELAVVVILLLFIHIDLDDLKETLNQESSKKESDQEK
jgi:hypothetical protein